MVFRPPIPTPISGAGGGGGSTINNENTSIAANGDNTISIKTNDTVAMVVNDNQQVLIGAETTSSAYKLSVSDDAGFCIELVNAIANKTATLSVNNAGELVMNTNGNTIQFGSNNVKLQNLFIGATKVLATASQLNYLANSALGVASASSALIVDSNRNVSNINDLNAAALGGILTTANQPNITSLNDVNISTLRLGGTQVNSTAAEINYLRGITLGNASIERVLTTDINKDVAGIRSISATNLYGTIQTVSQPNITSVGTLTGLNTTGLIGIGTNTPARSIDIVSSTPFIRLTNGANSLEIGVNNVGNSVINMTQNLIFSPNKNIQFAGSSVITGLAGITATALTGTIQTASQPNITEIGTLSSLNSTGDVIIGNSNASTDFRVSVMEPSGNLLKLSKNGSTHSTISINANGDLNITMPRDLQIQKGLRMAGSIIGATDITCSTLTGTIQTASQPNITQIGTLDSLNVSNTINTSSLISTTLTGTLQTANQPNITQIGTLSSLNVNNAINATSIIATTLTGTLQTANQPNITQIGTLTNLAVSNAINTASLTATTINGTIQTAAQPNITQIGTLSSLNVANGINANSIISDTLEGTIQTASQPNITEIGTLSSLIVSNSITTSSMIADFVSGTLQTANQSNITRVGTLVSLNVSDGINANFITANELTGTLQTANQPNITQIGTLNNLRVNGPIGINKTPTCIIDADTTGLTSEAALRITDGTHWFKFNMTTNALKIDTDLPTLSIGTNIDIKLNGGTIIGLSSFGANELTGTLQTASQPNITEIGQLNDLVVMGQSWFGLEPNGANTKISMYESLGRFATFSTDTKSMTITIGVDPTLDSSTDRIALANNVNLVLNNGTIIGLDTLDTTITKADQPNITSLGDLQNLTVLNDANLNSVHITGDLTLDGEFLIANPPVYTNLESGSLHLTGTTNSSSTTSGGTLTVSGGAAFAKDVYIGQTLNVGTSLIVNGTTIDTALFQGINATEGIVEESSFVKVDQDKNITGFNSITTNLLYGTIMEPIQSEITEVGTLSALSVDGFVGIGTDSPQSSLEINSTNGNCLRIRHNSSSATMHMTVDTNGICTMSPSGHMNFTTKMVSPSLVVGNSTDNIMPIEIGFAPFQMTGAYSFRNSMGSNSLVLANPNAAIYNYSIRALGRILCTQSIDVMSDKRSKKNIQNLQKQYCKDFIQKCTPVSYEMIDGDGNIRLGYIAQDIIKQGYPELVNVAPDKNSVEHIDEDGFTSPAGMKFTLTYENIIPILAKNQQEIMNDMEALKKENQELKDKLNELMKALLFEK